MQFITTFFAVLLFCLGAVIEFVRAHRVGVDITNHGTVVARIVPVKSDAREADWAEIDALAAEIGAMQLTDAELRRDL